MVGNNGACNIAFSGKLAAAKRPSAGECRVFLWSCVAIIAYLVLAYLVFVRPGVHRVDHVLAMLLPAFIIGLSAGVQALAARRLGESRFNETAVPLNGGLILALIIGVPLCALLFMAIPSAYTFLSDDPAVIEQGVPYLQVRILSMVAVGMNFSFRGYWSAIHMTGVYLRTLLIHGARAALNACKDKTDKRSRWVQQLQCRRNTNIATVALANKNARIVWAILSRGESYQPG